jgi:hypothetical protein
VAVEVRGAPRQDATTKDSKWVVERQGLESLRGPDVDEIILSDSEGVLYEGSQTNFFVLRDGPGSAPTLQTAGEVGRKSRQHAVLVGLGL